VFVSQGKARRAESDSLETEALITALRQQADIDSAAVEDLSVQLDAARLKVGARAALAARYLICVCSARLLICGL